MIYSFKNIPEQKFTGIFEYVCAHPDLTLMEFRFLAENVDFKLRVDESNPNWLRVFTDFIRGFRIDIHLETDLENDLDATKAEIVSALSWHTDQPVRNKERRLQALEEDLRIHIEREEYEVCALIKQGIELLTQKKTA